jgi:hypothetical protein
MGGKMVSARVNGIYRISIRSPQGNTQRVYESRAEYVGAGGSSEGAIANSPEKWAVAPLVQAPTRDKFFYGGCELVLSIIPDAGATLDISDGRFVIPITLNNGQVISLSNDALSMNGYLVGDTAIVAGQETVIAVHRAPEGRKWLFGGDKIFISIENNA